MSRRRVLIAVATIALFACLNIAWGMFFLPTIPPHRGDGTFQNISRRAGPFAIPGYSISMPEFDLAEPHQAEYRVADLANIGGDCMLYLSINDPEYKWLFKHREIRQLVGRLHLQVV